MSQASPTVETAIIDAQKQRQAKEYARIRRYLMVADLALGGVYALAWLIFGWSAALREALLSLTTNEWLLVLLYALVFGGIYYLIDLPLSFYAGYTLPHRFGQSNQDVKGWASDQVKGLLVGGVIGALVLEVIYAVLRAYPETWWLWAAGILLLFNVVLAILAPVLLMPIFYKVIPLDAEHADLVARLTRLAQQAGTQVRGVYKFDMSRRTKAANAALTGLGKTRRIILADTLISEFSPDEIETVLAHELGHHVNRDIPLLIVVDSILTLVGLYLAGLGLSWGIAVFGFSCPADIAALPLFLLVMGGYSLVTIPLSNGFSRWRERLADEYALQATGKGEAYASALARLSNQNLADADPQPWVEWLLYSHPALGKRIRMAQGWPKQP
jgi:STE24 endopeptidase